MKLGQEVWVWRMISMKQWSLVKATVTHLHSGGEITVDFELNEQGRYPRSGVYEVKGDAVSELPMAYKAIRNRLT